jgi:GlpG protein
MAFIRQAPVSVVLMALSVAVALASGLGEKLELLTWLTLADLRSERSIAGGLSAVQSGEVWRLITPIFIHFGILHLVFNMLWLKDLGHLIEQRWSSRTLLLLVLVSAVLSNISQFVVNWDFQNGVRFANALSGGMSGVVYALLGYIWIRGRCDPHAGIRLPPSIVWMMLGWLVFCMTGMIGHIGNSAHAVGLLVGMAWGWIAAQRSQRPSRPSNGHT